MPRYLIVLGLSGLTSLALGLGLGWSGSLPLGVADLAAVPVAPSKFSPQAAEVQFWPEPSALQRKIGVGYAGAGL